MNSYICLLRGINVSGKNKILMKDLNALFVQLGFLNVVTYIQSGNINFDSIVVDKRLLETTISKGIQSQFGWEVKAFVLRKIEIQAILADCPYPIEGLKENEQLYFTFLDEEQNNEDIPLEIRTKTIDDCLINNRIAYILCKNGYGNTMLSNTFLEKKLKTTATTRNYATLRKLAE